MDYVLVAEVGKFGYKLQGQKADHLETPPPVEEPPPDNPPDPEPDPTGS